MLAFIEWPWTKWLALLGWNDMQWSKSSAHGCHGTALCTMWDVFGSAYMEIMWTRITKSSRGVSISMICNIEQLHINPSSQTFAWLGTL